MVMVPGGDGVDANFGGKGFGQTFCEHDYACFGGAVGNVAGPGENAADVGEVDNYAARLLEQRRGGLRAEERRFQIGVERGVPHFFGSVVQVGGQEIGGAVD